MHLSDTLVFGPLHPLLPQPVRVRLGALLVGLVAGLGILTFAGLVLVLGPAALPASARWLLLGWAWPAEPDATTQRIRVSSNPAGAAVLMDGRELGRTPATVSTPPGLILTLRRAGFLDAFVSAGAANADITLWQSEPEVRLVRAAAPWRVMVTMPGMAPWIGGWSCCTGSTVIECWPFGHALKSTGIVSLPGMPPSMPIPLMSMSTNTW